jgi:hypothetical protein
MSSASKPFAEVEWTAPAHASERRRDGYPGPQ